MRMAPDVAGVTLFAFASGAPDLFTQIAAVAAGEHVDQELAIRCVWTAGACALSMWTAKAFAPSMWTAEAFAPSMWTAEAFAPSMWTAEAFAPSRSVCPLDQNPNFPVPVVKFPVQHAPERFGVEPCVAAVCRAAAQFCLFRAVGS